MAGIVVMGAMVVATVVIAVMVAMAAFPTIQLILLLCPMNQARDQ